MVSDLNKPISLDSINWDDPKVWDLLCSGNSLGVFQAESHLVQSWLKKIKPRNLTELSAVIAAVRPGCLASGGTDEYVGYKNGTLIYEAIHPIVDDILAATNHSLLYQEQLILLGRRLAWQHLEENAQLLKADELRKAVGKKNQEKILKIGKEFVEGCLHNKVDQKIADHLFDIIRNSGRYLFNLAHSFKYATVAYMTAWLKYYYPREFFATYLSYARFKASIKRNGKEISSKWIEIHNLHKDVKKFGLEMLPPNVNSKNAHFALEETGIRYALSEIKYVSGNTSKILALPERIDRWQKFVLWVFSEHYGSALRSNSAEALIKTHAFVDTGLSRTDLMTLYHFCDKLSDKELRIFTEWCALIKNNETPITEINSYIESEAFLVNVTKKRKEIVRSLATFLIWNAKDDPALVEEDEMRYLGTNITLSKLDNILTAGNESLISECVSELCRPYEKRVVNIVVDNVKITETKTGNNPGQKMAIIDVHDSSAHMDKLPIFPDAFAAFSEFLVPGITLQMLLTNGKRGWVVDRVSPI